jgi:FG-GAP repeat
MPQFPAVIQLSSIDGTNGFRIPPYPLSPNTPSVYGAVVAGAGDVNGDGFSDLIIGESVANGFAGGAYIVFGKASGFSPNLDLSNLNGSNGFEFLGPLYTYFGSAVASAGDVNGDGFADLIVSAPEANGGGFYNGSVYLVFGKASGFPATVQASSLNGSNGFEIDGTGNIDVAVWSISSAGWSVSSAGDVNGEQFRRSLLRRVRARVGLSGKHQCLGSRWK